MEERIKINLEEILEKHGVTDDLCTFIKPNIKNAMKEACKQTLELVAENAKAYDTIHHWNSIVVDKQLIIDTINQIE